MAVLTASLASGYSHLHHACLDQSANLVIRAVRQLGIDIDVDTSTGRVDVTGRGGHWIHSDIEFDCGNDSQSTCLLMAACCLGYGRYQLQHATTGVPAIRSLANTMIDLGQQVQIEADPENPHIQISAGAFRGGRTAIQDPLAGEAASSLLLVAPCGMGDLYLELANWSSRPTCLTNALHLLDQFGVTVIDDLAGRIIVPAPQVYTASEFDLA